jgi:DNA-binding transcriptional ArsR family regulator
MARKRGWHPVLSEQALDMLSARFRALGDPTRLRIINTLMQGECCVSDLVESTGLEQPCVSRHLIMLRREGILARRAEGNRAYYSIEDSTVTRLFGLVCGGLSERLAEELDALPDGRGWRGAGI